jgi:hypothetical protein
VPTLEITTNLGCALACRFCPQGRLVKSYPGGAARMLSLERFKLVVGKLPAGVRIDFSGMAEPWLNPDATAMVVHAFELGRKVAIYTTLQGMAATDAAMLIERYVSRISWEMPWVIHLPDREGNMMGWKPSPAYFDTLARFVALRRDRAPPGFFFMTMSPEGAVAEALYPVFGETLDRFVAISRAENLDRAEFSPSAMLQQVRHEGALLCASTPFFDHNTMLPNGDVVLCCMDYSREHVLGNLFRQSYADLFVGAEMAAIRTRAMGLDQANLICRRCHNVVRLSQGGRTHWQLQNEGYWTPRHQEAAEPPPVASPHPISRLRNLVRRLADW